MTGGCAISTALAARRPKPPLDPRPGSVGNAPVTGRSAADGGQWPLLSSESAPPDLSSRKLAAEARADRGNEAIDPHGMAPGLGVFRGL